MTTIKDDFVFRSGKYQNKTYEFVSQVNPSYLDWVVENRPEMLREIVRKGPNTDGMTPREKFASLMPNTNFMNEKK
jgi:hypothetical protein